MTRKNLNLPFSISAILPNVLKPIRKKFSSKLIELNFNWERIFGKQFSDLCYPERIYIQNKVNILELTVKNNSALELSYQTEEIKKKINCFFNNEFIDTIKIKKTMRLK